MNPKHKELVSKSELSKATILWSNLCPEDKAFMVTDDELKERMNKLEERLRELELEILMK
jgi:hypothetical protein